MFDTKELITSTDIINQVEEKMDKISIFISHKSKDRKMAEQIIKILKKNDDENNPKITFFISYDIPGGDRWYETIRRNLKESNILLLLFTDSNRKWDWCLYEAGLFDHLEDDPSKRIICLHNSRKIPAPLKHLQGFSATVEDMKNFLEQLFITTKLTGLPEPICPQLKNYSKQHESQAQELASLLHREVAKTDWFSHYFFLTITEPDKLQGKTIPPDSKVKADHNTLNDIFDLMDGEYTWQDIENVMPEDTDKRWMQDLAGVLYAVSKKRMPEPIETTFPAVKGVKLYQPSLYRADRNTDGSILFKILFFEDISFRLNKVPSNLAQLMISIIMATRFKFELLKEYLTVNKTLNIKGSFETTCHEIKQVIIHIEKDASSKGLLDRNVVTGMFEKEKNKTSIKKMFAEWDGMREKLMSAPEEGNEEEITKCLLNLVDYNNEFLRLANYRYAELMAM